MFFIRVKIFVINNNIYFNLTSQYYKCMKSFSSLLSERRGMRASKNAVLGLGVGSNPGPLAPESCVLPCVPLHIHIHIVILELTLPDFLCLKVITLSGFHCTFIFKFELYPLNKKSNLNEIEKHCM